MSYRINNRIIIHEGTGPEMPEHKIDNAYIESEHCYYDSSQFAFISMDEMQSALDWLFANRLTNGTAITIGSDGKINGAYRAGTGISIAGDLISGNLVGGNGITISGNVISANLGNYCCDTAPPTPTPTPTPTGTPTPTTTPCCTGSGSFNGTSVTMSLSGTCNGRERVNTSLSRVYYSASTGSTSVSFTGTLRFRNGSTTVSTLTKNTRTMTSAWGSSLTLSASDRAAISFSNIAVPSGVTSIMYIVSYNSGTHVSPGPRFEVSGNWSVNC